MIFYRFLRIERWNREHKCSPIVQLHVLQDILEIFPRYEDAHSEVHVITDSEQHQVIPFLMQHCPVRKPLVF